MERLKFYFSNWSKGHHKLQRFNIGFLISLAIIRDILPLLQLICLVCVTFYFDCNHHYVILAQEDVLDEFDTPDIGSVGDGVAEPLYSLISEIFEIRGVFRILRKSLMTFVQITYGSTINKHIKDTVAWLTSDLMIARCLKTIKLTLWPMNSVSFCHYKFDFEKG